MIKGGAIVFRGLRVTSKSVALGLKIKNISGGFYIGKIGLRVQSHTHFLNPLKGKGVTGAINASHLNINKFHVIYNPKHWGKLTNSPFNPFRF